MRPRSLRPLEAAEHGKLIDTFNTSKGVRLVRRCQAISLSADGWQVRKTAESLHGDGGTGSAGWIVSRLQLAGPGHSVRLSAPYALA